MTPTARNRTQLAAIGILAVVLLVLVYRFIVAGSTLPSADDRVAVALDPGERALMLHEMRGFVAAVQMMTDALARDDMAGVAKAARGVGAAKAHDVPQAMLGKLPFEFKTLAFAAHRGFDGIASAAESGATTPQILGQLATVLGECVACHSRYALAPPTAASAAGAK